MDIIRASNITHLAGVPYKLLQEIDCVQYEEHSPTENGELLRNGEVDVALIPIVEWVRQGEYSGFDFGLGTRRRSDSMVLYAQQPLSETEKIYVYECSCTSEMLLRLLLIEKWQHSPEIVRTDTLEPYQDLGPGEGALGLHSLPGAIRSDFPLALDLGTAWYNHTGLPFVFLVWAAAPGRIDLAQQKELVRWFHRGDHLKRKIARAHAPAYGVSAELAAEFVDDNRRYYLDQFLRNGLEEFLGRVRKHGLLAADSYDSVKYHSVQIGAELRRRL